MREGERELDMCVYVCRLLQMLEKSGYTKYFGSVTWRYFKTLIHSAELKNYGTLSKEPVKQIIFLNHIYELL